MCAQNMCIYICVARKNVLAAPNCNKKQLIGKNKTFLHDVYEKAFFSKIISFYIKRRRTFFIENKAKLRATSFSTPFGSFKVSLKNLSRNPESTLRSNQRQ